MHILANFRFWLSSTKTIGNITDECWPTGVTNNTWNPCFSAKYREMVFCASEMVPRRTIWCLPIFSKTGPYFYMEQMEYIKATNEIMWQDSRSGRQILRTKAFELIRKEATTNSQNGSKGSRLLKQPNAKMDKIEGKYRRWAPLSP